MKQTLYKQEQNRTFKTAVSKHSAMYLMELLHSLGNAVPCTP